VGQKVAIVSNKPQTTRNRILAVVNKPAGQIVLFDTPGLHKPMHAHQPAHGGDRDQEPRPGGPRAVGGPTPPEGYCGPTATCAILATTQVKTPARGQQGRLMSKPKLLPLMDRYQNLLPFAEIVPVSAKAGDNVDRLVTWYSSTCPRVEALYPDDFLTDQPERFFVSEIVREKILHTTR
jgi:GTP-binding protein Era